MKTLLIKTIKICVKWFFNDAASIDFQAWVFERHFCAIQFHNGVLQEQSVNFID